MTVSKLLVGAVAIVGFAALAPGALAAERPDDRAGPLGVGSVETAQPDVVIAYGTADTVEARINAGLDARGGLLVAVRPDDRAGLLGVGGVAPTAAQPDVVIAYGTADTVEARINAGLDARSGVLVAVRPDDRAGLLGVGAVAATATAEPVRPDDRPVHGVGGATAPIASTDGVGVPAATAEPPGVVAPATGQPGDTPLIDWSTEWSVALAAALLAAIVGFVVAYRMDHRPVGPRMTRGPGGPAATH